MTIRRVAVACSLALLAATSVSLESLAGSGPVRPPVPWSELPPRLRPLIHPTAAQIPPIPGESDSMLDWRRWPKTWTIGGRSYHLRYQEQGPHGERTDGLRDPARLHPGFTYVTYYGDHFGARTGPAFAWWPDGSLAWRSQKTDLLEEDWFYDTKGRLFRFWRSSAKPFPRSWLSCERHPSSVERHHLMESFSEDGELVAFSAENAAYWRGVRLPYRAFSDSLHPWLEARDPQRGQRRE